jgi:hypothetical protein
MFFDSINQLTSFIIDLKQSKTQEDINVQAIGQACQE